MFNCKILERFFNFRADRILLAFAMAVSAGFSTPLSANHAVAAVTSVSEGIKSVTSGVPTATDDPFWVTNNDLNRVAYGIYIETWNRSSDAP